MSQPSVLTTISFYPKAHQFTTYAAVEELCLKI